MGEDLLEGSTVSENHEKVPRLVPRFREPRKGSEKAGQLRLESQTGQTTETPKHRTQQQTMPLWNPRDEGTGL